MITRTDDDEEDYSSAFLFNPSTLDDTVSIYVRYTGPEQHARLQALNPDRPVRFIGIPEGRKQQVQVLPVPGS